MILDFNKSFKKQFIRLSSPQKLRARQSLEIFQQYPYDTSLRNHPLKGEWQGYRSISAGGDLRLHFKVVDENKIVFVAIGSHSQLYK